MVSFCRSVKVRITLAKQLVGFRAWPCDDYLHTIEQLIPAIENGTARFPETYAHLASAGLYWGWFSPGARYRKAVVAEMESMNGAVIGDARYGRLQTPEGHATTLKTFPGYSACGDFASLIERDAAKKAGTPGAKTIAIPAFSTGRAELQQRGAWHAATPGHTDQPREGDIYFLEMDHSNLDFRHLGFVKRVDTTPDGRQRWTTIDGGAGGATPMVKQSENPYDPATCRLGKAKLAGWADIEKLAE